VRRLLCGLLFVWFTASAGAQSTVMAVSVDGVVHPITTEIISHAIEQAVEAKADVVLIRLNTPGGLLEATREITQKIVASPVPVVTYVTPSGGRAASAGFFLLEAGDVAAMAPGTRTGAATPILLGQKMEKVMRRKAENDAAAALRSICEKRGRNAELAQKAVLEAKAFTETEALQENLIELIASDETGLFRQLDGREVIRLNGEKQTISLASPRVIEYEKTIREGIISAIADPNIAFVLLALGALGVYIEFSSPGLILPGVAGGILLLLGMSALSVMPINWVGVGLLLLAVALFVLEAHFASHGILGAGGTVSMVLGALLLVDAPPELRIHLGTALAVTLPFAAITVFLLTLVLRARWNKVVTGSTGMIGEIGTAFTALEPNGRVLIHGEYWNAVAPQTVKKGARVRVTKVDGLTLHVEPAGEKEGGSDV